MKILEYYNLDTSRVRPQYQKTIQFLQNDDFYSAEVKKLHPTEYYRAKLDYTNRLLFKIVEYDNQKYALILEVIHQHAYEKSTFLRGAAINESKILSTLEEMQSEPMAYINPQQPHFHFLDKIISFDPEQAQAFILPCPVIIIGSAGSGKTALTLEKMKEQKGDIAYITHSPYLAQHSRALYYTHHHVTEDEEERVIDFLSYREFLETIEVPKSHEINFRVFAQWLRQVSKGSLTYEPHKLYEEFKGVLSGTEVENAYLTEEVYYHLGIKQSIYSQAEKEQVYALYRKCIVRIENVRLTS